jgi:hypothetical protein
MNMKKVGTGSEFSLPSPPLALALGVLARLSGAPLTRFNERFSSFPMVERK